MTLTEAAAELGLEPSTLRHQIRNGRIRARKVGPVWTVTPAELAHYRAEHLGKIGQYLGKAGRPAKVRA
jgi:excisionase family DNA binding protein